MAEFSIVPFTEFGQTERWDAEFFGKAPTQLLSRLARNVAQPLSTFIANAQRGQAPAYVTGGTVPVIRTVNVRDLELSDTRQEFVTQEFFEHATKGAVGQFDIVVTSTGVGTLGRAFCNLSDRFYFADGHITVLSPKPEADHAYLAAVLQSSVGKVQFERWQRGSSGQIEIYPEDIMKILIPTLPRETQQLVSDLWREAIEIVQRAETFYPEAEQELLERLGWGALPKMNHELFFMENTTMLDSAERFDAEHYQPKYRRLREQLRKSGAARLGNLCHAIDKGTQPDGYIEEGSVFVVKSKNVFGQGIDFDACERTSSDAYDDVPARLSEGDVVINSTGLGTLGRAGFIPNQHPEKLVAAVDLLTLHLHPNQTLPEYISLFLNSPAGMAQSEMFQTGSSGQLHLYPQHVKEMLIFMPRNKDGTIDLTWQKKVADKVTGASTAMKEAQTKLQKAKALVEDVINKK